MYIRFQAPTPGRRGVHTGVFGLTNVLARNGQLSEAEYADWRAGNDWYTAAYPDPSYADPTVYDEVINPRATAWFKDSATHLLERIPRYLEILRAHDVECVRVEASDPGACHLRGRRPSRRGSPHGPDDEKSYHPAPNVRRG